MSGKMTAFGVDEREDRGEKRDSRRMKQGFTMCGVHTRHGYLEEIQEKLPQKI